jgi:two-component system nitrogen regulation response regulator NtrX
VTTEPLTVAINIDQPLHDARVEFERAFLVAVLRKHAGNISATAQAIGFERSAFHRKLKSLGIRVTIERVLRITSPMESHSDA